MSALPADASDPATVVGYAGFGKLPGAGDFVSRRMPYPLQQYWDRWCASGMELLKERNPVSGWALWGSTPKWAFLLPAQPGVPISQLGVLAPSCDRVGRNYPFIVTAAITDINAAHALPRAAAIVLAWAQVIADAQTARAPVDGVDGALGAALATELAKEVLSADAEITLPPGVSPSTLPWPGLAESFDRHGAESYWWSVPPATTGFRARTHSGTLSATLFATLCA
ncbi:MAG: type VI secretion system-associated protein TagF [Burkholderiales bacterium]|nr:type VI secretion system-associated protein TagF [Burkholderiales bacterium]